jgi:hypothetical protein
MDLHLRVLWESDLSATAEQGRPAETRETVLSVSVFNQRHSTEACEMDGIAWNDQGEILYSVR